MYSFQFKSRDNEYEWMVTIRSTNKSIDIPGYDIALSEESPAMIEWQDAGLMDPVQGSSLTLTLHSLTDRQYYYLHSAADGDVVAEVYRKVIFGYELYWSGTLDTEFYEEPYSRQKDYDVQMVFSDFGVLERKEFDGEGVMTVEEVIKGAIEAAGLDATKLTDISSIYRDVNGTPMLLSKVKVLAENFYDENGGAMTMRQVLDEVLRPFAFRLVQRNGRFVLYDINALSEYEGTDVIPIRWQSDDARLSVSPIYNRIRLTHSPFATSQLADGTLAHTDVMEKRGVRTIYRIIRHIEEGQMFGFNLYRTSEPKMKLPFDYTKDGGGEVFQISKMTSGENTCGVIYTAYGSGYGFEGAPNVSTGQVLPTLRRAHSCYNTEGRCISTALFGIKTPLLTFPANRKYGLRITLETLIDPRYNPYEDAGEWNDKKNYNDFQNWANFGYVPVKINVIGADGAVRYHFDNEKVVKSAYYMADYGEGQTTGLWVAGEGEWGDCFLSYYNQENRKQKSGFGLWSVNKQTIGCYFDDLPRWLTARGEGLTVDMPPCEGRIEVVVGSGIYQFNDKREEKSNVYDITRWVAYRNLKVVLTDKYGEVPEDEDMVYSAWLNPNAHSDLNADIIIDTAGEGEAMPSAQGYLLDEELVPIKKLVRAGQELQLSHLYIAATYSAYAEAHPVLSGTTKLTANFGVYRDAMMPERLFMATRTLQDLREGTEQTTYHAIQGDQYTPLEEQDK